LIALKIHEDILGVLYLKWVILKNAQLKTASSKAVAVVFYPSMGTLIFSLVRM